MAHFFVYIVGGGLAVTFFLISLAAMVAVLDIAAALRRISRTLDRIELAFAQPPYGPLPADDSSHQYAG